MVKGKKNISKEDVFEPLNNVLDSFLNVLSISNKQNNIYVHKYLISRKFNLYFIVFIFIYIRFFLIWLNKKINR